MVNINKTFYQTPNAHTCTSIHVHCADSCSTCTLRKATLKTLQSIHLQNTVKTHTHVPLLLPIVHVFVSKLVREGKDEK